MLNMTALAKPLGGGPRGCRQVWFAAASAFLLAVVTILPAGGASEVADRARELEQLRARIAEIKGQMERARRDEDALEQQLSATDHAIAESLRRLEDLERRLGAFADRLVTLRSERRDLESELEQQRTRVAEFLRAAYVSGSHAPLRLLLDQDSAAKAVRGLAYQRYFHEAQMVRVRALSNSLEAFALLESRVEGEQRELQRVRETQFAEQARLDVARAQQYALLAALRTELADGTRELGRLQQDEERLGQLLETLRKGLPEWSNDLRGRSFPDLRGRLRWPVAGRIVGRYGTQRTGHLSWQGVMIAAGEGQEVRAIAGGRVVFADWLRGYGWLLIVDHGKGYMSLYGHNEQLYPAPGQKVDPGEIIGRVGVSGGIQRPALYFEIRHNGAPMDPAGWCASHRRST